MTHADANRVEEALVENHLTTQEGDNYAESSKRKMLEALSSFFLYRAHVHGGQPWTPDASFNQTDYNQSDYFTLREREQLYDSALEYGDPGDVDNLSEEELDDLKQQLSESLKKPKEEVSEADIRQRRENWKVPSLISVALDLGLRPIEIERFETTWFRPGKSTIYIPSEKAAKNVSNWELGLSSRSDRILRWWLKQREEREKYADSKRMWLNSVGNPYNSGSLNHLLQNLIGIADIDTEGRKLNWYSIRRSTGVYLTYFHSLAYTKEQLRHNSLQSTLRYVEIPTEARQQVLDALQGGLPLEGHGESPTLLGPEGLQ